MVSAFAYYHPENFEGGAHARPLRPRALGEAGAFVYCTGRSVRGNPSPYGRPKTIDETAGMITGAGGRAVAVRVDHTVESEVEALFGRVKQEQGRLDVLVDGVAGEDPLMIAKRRGLIVEVTENDVLGGGGNPLSQTVKSALKMMALNMAAELKAHHVAAAAITPGFLRSESMLQNVGVTEANWRWGDFEPDFSGMPPGLIDMIMTGFHLQRDWLRARSERTEHYIENWARPAAALAKSRSARSKKTRSKSQRATPRKSKRR